MNSSLFEWQQETWTQIIAMRQRMPHAILLYGNEGIGKAQFAEYLAKSLLCETPTLASSDSPSQACGHCISCNWFDQYSHPDYRRVRPGLLEEDEVEASGAEVEVKTAKASKTPSKEILIDQVRALTNFMNISTHRQGQRVVLLYPVEALNVHAANALLKSLEEPNPNTVFILVSHRIDRLLPTILSRCHKLPMPMPTREQALAWLSTQAIKEPAMWLAQQGGAPLLALSMAQSEDAKEMEDFVRGLTHPDVETCLKLADKMQKLELPRTISCLQRWLYDIFSCKFNLGIRYYPKYQAELQRLAAQSSTDQLMKIIQSVQDRQAIASHPLSAKLFLEDMLLEYSSSFVHLASSKNVPAPN
ncbi:MAG: DNA polymerase III subunit delta' [Undibacterium sp.]|nr:DNA polymerase III subunit delta' [Undibacterium sp.]